MAAKKKLRRAPKNVKPTKNGVARKARKPTKAVKKATKKATKKVLKSALKKNARKRAEKATALSKSEGRFHIRTNEIRQTAAVEYITDSHGRSVAWWHAREDRPYRKVISLAQFQSWSVDDDWAVRRSKFWNDVEHHALEKLKHSAAVDRYKAYEEMLADLGPMLEYMRPLRDKAGVVKRYEEGHPLEGLPIFPLEFGKMHNHVGTVLEMQKVMMLLRGEATARIESTAKSEVRKTITIDPVQQNAELSEADVDAMARALLLQRQPELVDAEIIDIDHSEYEEAKEDEEYL